MTPDHVPGKREQVATRIVFFIVGLVMASWAPLVPLVKARLGLDERALGTLLLCAGLGSLGVMPFSGGFAGRFGCRKTILAGGIAGLVALPVMATCQSVPILALGLVLFGASISLVDVTMNIQAVLVERASGKAMMSGFHGLFSVGGIAGAGAVTGLLAMGASPLLAAVASVFSSLVLMAAFVGGLLPYGGERDTPAFALPKGQVLLIGILCCCSFLAEGSVLDWSGVLLNLNRGVASGASGLGYVAFSATMTFGRLTGDAVVSRLGPRRVLIFGGLLAALGFGIAALVPNWLAAIGGFALVGVGAANLVPVLFSAAGRQKSMPANMAIAAATTVAYTGMIAGPALIGFVAHATSLPSAFLVVAGLLVLVAFSGGAAGRS